MTLRFSRVDALEPFNTNQPAPRGSDILASCVFHDFLPSATTNNNSRNVNSSSAANAYSDEDGVSVAFFNTGALAVKRVSREKILSFATEAQQKQVKKELEQLKTRGGTSTLCWNDLMKETAKGGTNNGKFIVGTTFNNDPKTRIERIISSHVDVGIIYPAATTSSLPPPQSNSTQRVSQWAKSTVVSNQQASANVKQQQHLPSAAPQRDSSSSSSSDDDDDSSNSSDDSNHHITAAAGGGGGGGGDVFTPRGNEANDTTVPFQQQQQQPMMSIQPSQAMMAPDGGGGSNIAALQVAAEPRYVIVGAALCELRDGRCALFTVSTHVSNADLTKGTPQYQLDYLRQQQQRVAEATRDGKAPPTQTALQPQKANYTLDAETSILELPADCVSVEIQVATSSVLVRVAEKRKRKTSSAAAASGGRVISSSMPSESLDVVAATSILCLGLDTAGRPIGAASLRGRALGPFSAGMAGVRAVWRISEDGICTGNMQNTTSSNNGATFLDDWILIPSSRNGNDKAAMMTSSSSSSSQTNNVTSSTVISQRHQVLTCAWLEPLVLLHRSGGPGSSTHPQFNNSSNSFSCLSVVLSEWKELIPNSNAGSTSPFFSHTSIGGAGGGGLDGKNNILAGNASTTIDHAVCTVLLSQMVAADPVDTLHGFHHRKLVSFPRPALFATECDYSSFHSAGAAEVNAEGTIMLLTAPNTLRSPSAGVCIAVVVLGASAISSSSGSNYNSAAANDNSSSSCSVVTFQVLCSHGNSLAHHAAAPRVQFKSNRSAIVFFPCCGCFAPVPDLLRVAPIVGAEPVLGFGCLNPLSSLGLRNSEKFFVLPRLARTILAPAPPQISHAQLASAMSQVSFFEHAGFSSSSSPVLLEASSASHMAPMNNTNNYLIKQHLLKSNLGSGKKRSSGAEFMFAGFPSESDSKSGSALSIVVATTCDSNDSSGSDDTLGSGVVQRQQQHHITNSTTNDNSYGGVSNNNNSSPMSIHRLVDSVGAEALFLSQQFRALDVTAFSFTSAASVFLNQAGLAMLEAFFRRAAFVVAICTNAFSRDESTFDLLATSLIQLAKCCEVVLESFQVQFADRVEPDARNSNNNNSIRQQQQNVVVGTKTRIEQTMAHFTATAFAQAVSKLLQFGLISAASRVVHAVGPYCDFLVDLVYPSAAALYKKSHVAPSAASYLHDIESMVSMKGREVLKVLENIRTASEI